jgi:hypothetical protein
VLALMQTLCLFALHPSGSAIGTCAPTSRSFWAGTPTIMLPVR